MKSTFLKIALAATLPVVMISCGGEKTVEEQPVTDSTATAVDTTPVTVSEEVKFKFDFAVANIPSPVQVINDFSSYGLPYNSAILHDVNKVKSYSTDFAKSINLGVYNLDMSYAIANGQGADVMKYLKTSMSEADALGLKAAFDQMVGKRAEDNVSNKDSLLTLIDDIYVKGDSYLRTNDRVQTATHVFVGSWIEALHIICAIDKDEKDAAQKAKIHSHLWDQRFYIKNIIDLLSSFKDKKEDKMLIDELTKIQAELEVIKDPKDLDDTKFKSISDKISALRTSITK
ncbi:MAG TPA: hypothetical protein VGF30_09870 [Bacteroidia bacterium]